MKPWLWLPPQLAHDLSPWALKIISFLWGSAETPSWKSLTWQTQDRTLHFQNRLGIAGGVDKNAASAVDWQNLGCGFLEIGTVTLKPQKSNDGCVMLRDLGSKSLWNKMGFPSSGADPVLHQILKLKHKIRVPLFINLGKNRDTPNEIAHEDYIALMQKFQAVADAFVINLSSPNTQGLRALATMNSLDHFMNPLVKAHEKLQTRPALLLKLSPDLEVEDFSRLVQACLNYSVDGFILTNTTLSRDETPFYPRAGGVSGKPLRERSLKALEIAKKICLTENSKKIIISTGGVMTAADVFERIRLGADLVQVYTTLIFDGPLFFRKAAKIASKENISSARS